MSKATVIAPVTPCVLLLSLIQVALGQGQSCDTRVQMPVRLQITDVTLPTGMLCRGIPLEIGSSKQQLAFAPHSWLNTTYVFDQNHCDNTTTDAACQTMVGGLADHSDSYTWSNASIAELLPPLDDGFTTDMGQIATDAVQVNSTFGFPIYPFVYPLQAIPGQNTLGLGPSSSLLKLLTDSHAIASSSWSWFAGQVVSRSDGGIDGSIVIGGIDVAKTQGQNYTKPLVPQASCPSGLLVSFTDIRVLMPNHSNVSLLNGVPLPVCIEPGHRSMQFPTVLWHNFQNTWPSVDPLSLPDDDNDFYGSIFPANNSFPGDLTFTIDNQLEITLPNDLLVVDFQALADDGSMVKSNTYKELLIRSSEDTRPIFGGAFLQAAYLYMNWDESEYTLWKANRTSDENLVGIGLGNIYGCPSNLNITTKDGASSSSSKHAKLGAGAIAGIVIGAVVFGLLVIAFLGWFIRRRRHRHCYQETSRNIKLDHMQDYDPMYTGKSELAAENSPVGFAANDGSQTFSLLPKSELPGGSLLTLHHELPADTRYSP